jgi:hypothetical protein
MRACVCVGMCVRVCVCALSTLWLVGVPVFRSHCQRRRLQTPKDVGVVQLGPDLVGLGLLELDLLGSLAGSLAGSLTCSLCPLGSTSDLGERRTQPCHTRASAQQGWGWVRVSEERHTSQEDWSVCIACPILVLRGGGRADFDRVLASGEVGGLAVRALTEVNRGF